MPCLRRYGRRGGDGIAAGRQYGHHRPRFHSVRPPFVLALPLLFVVLVAYAHHSPGVLAATRDTDRNTIGDTVEYGAGAATEHVTASGLTRTRLR
ncbi:hypothetical protein [Streptomyces sp. ISL-100]|uniref:hypothetical protein n=1 Tax=Streptomyces sp. ISL-100 TaxID=2819173 RepID=UPI001BE987D2|nr:hypothetical protein [Streptomyces sp. ISL-100]MBT2395130.1 hypothetical protein [Streptomyces sp. ISL-100]